MGGHEGPVTSVAFSPAMGSCALVSSSWDKSFRIWDSVDTHSNKESVSLQFEGMKLLYIVVKKELP